ncbi:MAG: hypothetical protein U0324_37110 [Polyangiales bacterium]
MQIDRLPIAIDELTEIIAIARRNFHSYIGQTVRRRYKRLPIYLVDQWVTDALGFFTRSGLHQRGNPPPGFAHVANLFAALHAVLDLVAGARLLDLAREAEAIERAAIRGLEDPRHFDELGENLAVVRGVVFASRGALEREETIRPRVARHYFQAFAAACDALWRATDEYRRLGPPVIQGVSFDARRPGGLLLQSIKELDIEGPAVVIAPARVLDWAQGMPPPALDRADDEVLQRWFGVRRRERLPAAVALANVLQHELTHAMVALPNDPTDDEKALAAVQGDLDRRTPAFEEGMANFVAGLVTTHALMKARLRVRGNDVVPLSTLRYPEAFEASEPVLRWTYAGYHREATDDWFHAWEANGRDFKAFSGLLAMFATHPGANDWGRTRQELATGVITTTKGKK